MAEVFISYSRTDKDFVRKLHDALARLNRDTWVDWEDIPLTAEWLEEIYSGIEAADNFVFVISPESVASTTCREEIAYAFANHKRMIPIFHRPVADDAIPEGLAKINLVFFRDSDDFDSTFASLVEALDTDLDWKRTHTRLLVVLATASEDGKVRFSDAAFEELPALFAHKMRVEAVAWSPDGSRLASASWDGTVKIWDTVTGQELQTLRVGVGGVHGRVLSVAWSPDGKLLATGGQASTPRIWDATSGQNLLTLKGHARDATSVAWSPDGKLLASASLDQTAKVWDATSGQELRTLSGHVGRVRRVVWSPNGKWLATAGEDGTVRVWDSATGVQMRSWDGRNGIIHDLVWSPDSKRLGTAGEGQTADVWDATTGLLLVTLTGHNGIVDGVAWSPNGTQLATASEDETVKVWDAMTGRQMLTLLSHRGTLSRVAWSPDGKRLAATSEDGVVVQYAVDINLLLTLARQRVTRTLTVDECRKYLHADKIPSTP